MALSINGRTTDDPRRNATRLLLRCAVGGQAGGQARGQTRGQTEGQVCRQEGKWAGGQEWLRHPRRASQNRLGHNSGEGTCDHIMRRLRYREIQGAACADVNPHGMHGGCQAPSFVKIQSKRKVTTLTSTDTSSASTCSCQCGTQVGNGSNIRYIKGGQVSR